MTSKSQRKATGPHRRKKAKTLRSTQENEPLETDVRNAFDVFGSDLEDEDFAGVFDQPRQQC
jgi:hypothetical protein